MGNESGAGGSGFLRKIFRPNAKMHGCTVASRKQLAQARVLATSFRQHHPERPFTILLLDYPGEKVDAMVDGVTVISLDEINLSPGDAQRWSMLLDESELPQAVKPWLLRSLLAADSVPVLCFAPDAQIFQPLDDLADLTRKKFVATTGELNAPDAYEFALIAVAPGAEAFLDEWSGRVRSRLFAEKPARSGDRRSLEAFPSDRPHYVLDDRTCGAAFWNLDARPLSRNAHGYTIDGAPLRLFHFSGYHAGEPHLLSRHQGHEPKILLSANPALRALCEEYRAEILAAGFDEAQGYSFDFLPGGLRIDQPMRQLYYEALAAFDDGKGVEPPSPFGPLGKTVFLQWLNESLDAVGAGVSRYMLAIHSARADLQAAFPDPFAADAIAFRDWFLESGRRELDVPEALWPAQLAPQFSDLSSTAQHRAELPTDSLHVNLAGYFRAELGIGEAARLIASALRASGLPFNTVDYADTVNRQNHLFAGQQTPSAKSDINIVCVNADQLPAFAAQSGPAFYHGRYSIGVWFWEVEDFPESQHGVFNYVDEVWVATEFMRQTFAKVSPKPVFKFRLPIARPEIDESLSRRDVHLPEQFSFLFSFDFLSVLERKNPVGLIDAFTRAFRPGEGPALILKTINGDKRIVEMEKLRYAAARHPDIRVLDGYLSPVAKNTLMARCDSYVSLHRSEGFGLTMAEAMALGKPVIATAYSGNMDFMTAENSYLCRAQRCTVGPGREPYPATSKWAEPDLDHAASLLREVYANPAQARARGERAASDMRDLHSPESAGEKLRLRVETIRRRRARAGSAQALELLEDRVEALEAAQRALFSQSKTCHET